MNKSGGLPNVSSGKKDDLTSIIFYDYALATKKKSKENVGGVDFGFGPSKELRAVKPLDFGFQNPKSRMGLRVDKSEV